MNLHQSATDPTEGVESQQLAFCFDSRGWNGLKNGFAQNHRVSLVTDRVNYRNSHASALRFSLHIWHNVASRVCGRARGQLSRSFAKIKPRCLWLELAEVTWAK